MTHDDEMVLPYISHKASKIRRIAIKAVSRLNGAAHLNRFMDALTDEVPNISREARKALAGRVQAVGSERLWRIFQASPLLHVRRHTLSLLAGLPKWDSIYYLLEALCDSDAEIMERSRLYIRRWLAQFNREFSVPTSEQLTRLKSALDKCGGVLDEGLQEQLSFSTRGF